jgi:H+-transporting ATPase
MFSFQTLLFFALYSILSIRERCAFWRSRPSAVLSVAIASDACVGFLIGVHGLAELRPLPLGQTALIVGYTMISFLVLNDLVKTALVARTARVGRKA